MLTATGRNADAGSGDLFVAEADESDGAFLVYEPFAAVVTNVAADHLDVWGTEQAYREAFDNFARHVHPDGFLVCCVDDPGARDLAAARPGAGRRRRRRRRVRGGRPAGDRTSRSTAPRPRSRSSTRGAELGRVTLRIPGRHYVLDALAALAVGLGLGARLRGAPRRVSSRSPASGGGWRARARPAGSGSTTATPTTRSEISGDLQAARSIAGAGRLLVVFQPHLVSRTRIFGPEMGEALGAADEVVVLDVYLAREDADPAVTGALVADAVPLPPGAVAAGRHPGRRRGRGPGARPGPATWSSPSGPGTSPGSGPASWPGSRSAPMPSLLKRRPGPDADAGPDGGARADGASPGASGAVAG